jgi:hypothetical protein
MNTKHLNGFFVAILMLLGASGCITGRNDLARSGEVKVVTSSSKHTQVLNPSVYEEKGMLIVSGQVRRSSMSSGEIRGHVHIEQLSADGDVVRSSMTSLEVTSRGRRTRIASYTARLPWTLAPGSTIRVSLSGDQHPTE